MEVGSGSSTNSGQADSLHGLKFGQKIYFEAAVGGRGSGGGRGQQQGKHSSGSKAHESGRPPPAPAAKKGRSGAVPGGGQPPRCQVEGCQVDLSDAKTYYSRHKVCAAHSKSPQVIVGGIQQRFCQQCSRFHLLPEFDQGKRSCRRRLAGHNERRRKPQPGNLLSTRYGTLSSSSYFETNSRPGSFVMDFTSYPSLSGRNSWPNARTSELVTSNRPPTATGKSFQHPWQNNHEGPPELLMPCSASRSTYVASGISSGECYAGVSDSSRALSLLSTQSWVSSNESLSLGVNGLLDANGRPTVRPSASHGEANNCFSHSSLWGFKGCENSSRSSHEMPPDLGLRQLSQAANNQYSCDVDASRQNGRECLGLEHSQGYESPVQNVHWSL